jgi:uncharacterized protein involved in outer membrane biogenesis
VIAANLKSFWQSRRVRWITAGVAALVALYGAFGFWVAPGIARDQLVTQLSATLARPVTLESVRINPYVLSATLNGFAVSERDGSPIIAFDELYANLSATSLLRWAWTLSEIRLVRPRVELVLDSNGALNLASLGPGTPPPADAAPSGPVRVVIGQLTVMDGQVGFEDRRFPQAEPRRIDAMSFSLKDFSTLPEDTGDHAFTAVTDAGTTLQWRGTIGVNPLHSAGQLALSKVQLTQLAFYALPPTVQLTGGTLDLSIDYRMRIAPDATEFAVTAGRLALSDVRTRRADTELTPLNLEFTPIALRWQGAAQAGNTAQVALELVPNGSGRVAVQGTLGLEPLAADLSVNLNDVALAPFQTFVEPYARARLERGALSVAGTLTLRAGEPLDLRFEGGAVLADLAAVDTRREQSFARWRRLEVEKLNYASHPAALRIERVTADEPYLRFIVGPDRITNLQHILAVDAAGKAPTAPARDAGLQVGIGTVAVRNGSANFSDQSLTPNFATGIQQLNGTVRGLSSNPAARAKVALRGKVDRYAPALIDGEINPLAAVAYTDLALKFENIELTTFTPYSGKFAGFRIDKGRLTLDLRYRLQERALQGDNRIVLNQLTLGERVESADALELPIRLAIAILQDSRGVIDLDLPVSGNVDDPEFSYGALIGKAIVNLIMKAITAPFTLLAAAFGGGEELGFIAFAPGDAELAAAERDKLDKLARALADRPSLQLEVRGAASPDADRRALASAKIDRQVRGEAAPASDVPLSGAERRRLFALYRKTFNEDPAVPTEGLSSSERETRMVAAARERLIEALPVTDDERRELARARGSAIVDYLLAQPGGTQERVFLADVDTAAASGADGVRTQLKLAAR